MHNLPFSHGYMNKATKLSRTDNEDYRVSMKKEMELI